MPKSSGNYLVNQIDRLLIGSKSGIVAVRADISEKEALELIQRLNDEKRNIKPAEEISPWERPTRPTNLLLMTLLALKQNTEEVILTVRRNHIIPDGQALTLNQTTEVINRLLKQPTIPGREDELQKQLDALPAEFTWAKRV